MIRTMKRRKGWRSLARVNAEKLVVLPTKFRQLIIMPALRPATGFAVTETVSPNSPVVKTSLPISVQFKKVPAWLRADTSHDYPFEPTSAEAEPFNQVDNFRNHAR